MTQTDQKRDVNEENSESPKRKNQNKRLICAKPCVSFNFQLSVHGIKHRQHRYSLSCKVNIRDWNSHHRYMEQYSGAESALKSIPLLVHIETMYTHIEKISSDVNSAITLFLF